MELWTSLKPGLSYFFVVDILIKPDSMKVVTRGAIWAETESIDSKPSEPDLDETSVGKWRALEACNGFIHADHFRYGSGLFGAHLSVQTAPIIEGVVLYVQRFKID